MKQQTAFDKLSMDDVVEMAKVRRFTDKEKMTVLRRCLSDTAYWHNRGGVSAYAAMATRFGNELIKATPENSQLYIMTGNAYELMANDWGQAAKLYSEAVRLDPGNGQYYQKAAPALCLTGNFLAAAKLLDKCESAGLKPFTKSELKALKKAVEIKTVDDEIDFMIMGNYDSPEDYDPGNVDKPAIKIKAMGFKKIRNYYEFALFLFGGIFLLSGYLLDYPLNEPYNWGFKHAALPLSLIILTLLIKFPMTEPYTPLLAKVFLIPIMAALYLLMFMPVFGLINAYTGKVGPVKDPYTIVKKYQRENTDHRMEYYLVLKGANEYKPFDWEISLNDYGGYENGNGFNPGLYKGSLGLVFRYKVRWKN
jgi:tetratricopeptide (TPR) repeat protein